MLRPNNSLLPVDLELLQQADSDRQHLPIHLVKRLLHLHSGLNPPEECLERPQLPTLVSGNLQVDSVNLPIRPVDSLVNLNNNPPRQVSVSPAPPAVDSLANQRKLSQLLVVVYSEIHRPDSVLNQLNPLLPIHSGLLELLNPPRLDLELLPVDSVRELLRIRLDNSPLPLLLHRLLEDLARTKIRVRLNNPLLRVDCLEEVVLVSFRNLLAQTDGKARTTNNSNLPSLLVGCLELSSLLNPLLEACLVVPHPRLVVFSETLPRHPPLVLLPVSVSLFPVL